MEHVGSIRISKRPHHNTWMVSYTRRWRGWTEHKAIEFLTHDNAIQASYWLMDRYWTMHRALNN